MWVATRTLVEASEQEPRDLSLSVYDALVGVRIILWFLWWLTYCEGYPTLRILDFVAARPAASPDGRSYISSEALCCLICPQFHQKWTFTFGYLWLYKGDAADMKV